MTQTSQWPVPKDSIRYVVPEPIIRLLASHPLTRDLYPLAFGHYRRAVGHRGACTCSVGFALSAKPSFLHKDAYVLVNSLDPVKNFLITK